MYPVTIDSERLPHIDDAYLIENSASAAAVSIQLDVPSFNGIYQVIVDIDSFLDDYSFEREFTKSLMLVSEDVLNRIWDSPEEEEAWKDL